MAVVVWLSFGMCLVALQPALAWAPLARSRLSLSSVRRHSPTPVTPLVLEASSSGSEEDGEPADVELSQALQQAASLVGQRVNVCWPTKDDAEYNGMVTSTCGDGTVDVMYTLDNTYEQRVPVSRVAVQGPQPLDESFVRPLPGEDGYDALLAGGDTGGPNNTPRVSSSPEEDAATLEKYRGQLQRSNDNWQFSCLGDAHGTHDAGAADEDVARNTWLGLAQRWEMRPTAMGAGQAGNFGYGYDLVEVLPVGAMVADPANTPLAARQDWWGATQASLEVVGEARDAATGARCERVPGQTRAFTLRQAASQGAVAVADLVARPASSALLPASPGRASLALSRVAWAPVAARALAPANLRGELGTQTCGCAHAFTTALEPTPQKPTTADADNGESGNGGPGVVVGRRGAGVAFEVCLRSAQGTRLRLELAYRQAPLPPARDSGASSAAELELLEAPKWVLSTATVVREALGRWPDPAKDDSLFGPAAAPAGALYDASAVPPGAAGYAYRLLPLLDGRAVACFPAVLDDGPASKGAVCLDWAPGPGRFQVDRKFEKGNFLEVASLELTELLADAPGA